MMATKDLSFRILITDDDNRCREALRDIMQATRKLAEQSALAGKADGVLVDTSALIDHDVALSIVTDRDPEGLEIIRHSTAHLLANAVQDLYPDAQVTIGPVIEDGFYYDFAYKRPFSSDDLLPYWPSPAWATKPGMTLWKMTSS